MIKCGHCKGTHPEVADVRACAESHQESNEQFISGLAEGFRPPAVSENVQRGRQFAALMSNVPEGRYAVTLAAEGKLRFFRLDKPTEGKWKGYTFVKEQASDELYPVRDAARRVRIAEAIAKDPREAMLRYGRELGKCGHCGRTLTDEESRAAGIGPVCRNKVKF